MTKIRIKDTPQAYKDIVEFGIDSNNHYKLKHIGKEFDMLNVKEYDNYYSIKPISEWYNYPKSACEIIHEYKVNDWVEIVDPAGSDFEIGHIGKITAISDNGPNQLTTYEIDNDRTYLYGNDIKPCDPPPQPNYLEQAREMKNSTNGMIVKADGNISLIERILKTQELILKHLESKEVE